MRLRIGLVLACMATPLLALVAKEDEPKPNIILVFIDDLGWGDFSCFGNVDATTENIDALAAEGIRFEQFYVNSPICSPSRVAIATGQYPQRWQIGSYLANRQQNKERGIAQWLDPAAPMLARILHDQGYTTGHFGKWHMGGQRDVGDAPLIADYGFDASLTNFEGLGPRVLAICDSHDGKRTKRHTLGSDKLGRGYKTWLYEGGIRSSLIVWGPALIEQGKPGSVNTTSFFSAIDLVPSILDVSKVHTDIVFDGQNVAEVLLGMSDRSRAEPLFFRRPPDRDSFYGDDDLPDLATRDGKWKLLCEYDGSEAELYDLGSDRGETTNVVAENTEVAERLIRQLVQWHQALPQDNGDSYRIKAK